MENYAESKACNTHVRQGSAVRLGIISRSA